MNISDTCYNNILNISNYFLRTIYFVAFADLKKKQTGQINITKIIV